MSVLIWFLLVVLGFGAFGSVGSAETGSAVEEPPVPSSTQLPSSLSDPFPDDLPFPSTNAEIQERYATRSPLPACGFVEITTDDGGDQADEAWSCLQGAVGDDVGAELLVFDYGDPMSTTTYRVNPDGPLEIFVDAAVTGAKPAWQYRQCQPSDDLRTEPCAT
jgi:hypothetical protein